VLLFVFLPESFEQWQVDQVFLSATGLLAGDDVAQVGHPEKAHREAAGSGLLEAGDAIRCEDEIDIKRTGLDLDEVLAGENLLFQLRAHLEPDAPQRQNNPTPVLGRPRGENVHVLRRPRIAQEDGAALADEQVVHALVVEGLGDFLRLKRVEFPALGHGTRRKPRYSGRFASHQAR